MKMLEAALAGDDDDDGDLFGLGSGSAQPAASTQIESPAPQAEGPAAQGDGPAAQPDASGAQVQAPVPDVKSENTSTADNITDAAAPTEANAASHTAAPDATSGATSADSGAAPAPAAAPASGPTDTTMANSSSIVAADTSMTGTSTAPQGGKPAGGYVLERQHVPSRRESSRVKASSAFGEKLPEVLTKSEDFATMFEPMMQEHGWEAPKLDSTMNEAAPASSDAQPQGQEQVEASASITEAP